MNYTEQQKAEFMQEFKAKRRRQMILAVPIVLCFVFLITIRDKEAPTIGGMDASLILAPVLLLIVGGVAYSFYNWRCPACRKYLGKSISPSFCARCGVPLQ